MGCRWGLFYRLETDKTLVNGDWMASWVDFCPFGLTKTYVNTHWIVFWGVFHRRETNKTLVNGVWDAVKA